MKPGAIKSRKRRAGIQKPLQQSKNATRMTDEAKARSNKQNADRAALSRARKGTEKHNGFQDLSEEEQRKLLADAEAAVRQRRYVIVIRTLHSFSNLFTVAWTRGTFVSTHS